MYEMLCGYSPFREAKVRVDINIYFQPLYKDGLISVRCDHLEEFSDPVDLGKHTLGRLVIS